MWQLVGTCTYKTRAAHPLPPPRDLNVMESVVQNTHSLILKVVVGSDIFQVIYLTIARKIFKDNDLGTSVLAK